MSARAPEPAAGQVTRLLGRLAEGDGAAGPRLFELLHDELHREARAEMARQGPSHTLQATALVNEAWLRLAGNPGAAWGSRRHFLQVAAKAMRSVLVDHARKNRRQRRGDGASRAPLQEVVDLYAESAFDLVELDDALDRLAGEEERLARIVELRFFAGLTIAETADALEIGHATVERDWHLARIWLRRELAAG